MERQFGRFSSVCSGCPLACLRRAGLCLVAGAEEVAQYLTPEMTGVAQSTLFGTSIHSKDGRVVLVEAARGAHPRRVSLSLFLSLSLSLNGLGRQRLSPGHAWHREDP